MDKHLHIISLEIPYPPSHGGLYDLFYKLEALYNEGIKIHLHCFYKHKHQALELNKYCTEVFYYPRKTGLEAINRLPYIVASRRSNELLNRLKQDDYPVLMEGTHCTYLITDHAFANRKKALRMHNVEQHYYKELFRTTSSPIKKIFYAREANHLFDYERNLASGIDACFTVSHADTEVCVNELQIKNTQYIPLFLPPTWQVNIKPGMGTYCLYHGNLGVAENSFAAEWLLKNVFNDNDIPFVIAGKNPSQKLERLAHKKMHTCLVANPTEAQMQDMIAKSHIHVLPSFSTSGIKLKLLNALYNGMHCVVNENMLHGTKLSDLCHVANTAEAMKQRIAQLFHQPFREDEIALRSSVLQKEFNNKTSAKKIIEKIWNKI